MAEKLYHGIENKKEALRKAQKMFDAGASVTKLNNEWGLGRWPNSEKTKIVDWKLKQDKGKLRWKDVEKTSISAKKRYDKLSKIKPEIISYTQKNGKLFSNKSLEGFKNQMEAGKVQGEIERDIANVATFGTTKNIPKKDQITIGHGQAVDKGGTDLIGNTAPEVGKRNYQAQEFSGRSLAELDETNIGREQLKGFTNYLIDDEPTYDAGIRTRIHQSTESIDAILADDKRIKETRRQLKFVFKGLAKTAGKSNNPLANIGGDLVGVVFDGVAYAQNPNIQTLTDLVLSGSEAATSLGAAGLSLVPIPGSRVAAFALMKVGDNIGRAQQIMNMGREGFAMQNGKLRKLPKRAMKGSRARFN